MPLLNCQSQLSNCQKMPILKIGISIGEKLKEFADGIGGDIKSQATCLPISVNSALLNRLSILPATVHWA